jgi:hypothetical protein
MFQIEKCDRAAAEGRYVSRLTALYAEVVNGTTWEIAVEAGADDLLELVGASRRRRVTQLAERHLREVGYSNVAERFAREVAECAQVSA